MTIMLDGIDLTVTDVVSAARRGEPVALAPEAGHHRGGPHPGRAGLPRADPSFIPA